MKIISDFVTNSSEADYYDCDCDCNYKKKRYYNSSTNHMISKNTDCKSYKDSNIKFTSGDVSLFPVLTKTKIYSYTL